ncbi:MAG: TonB-dependent receptor [Blastocatellia bacterium]
MHRTTLQTLATLFLVLICSAPAFPQADVATATIKGIVTDEQQAAVPHATITVKSLDKGTVRAVTTNSEGGYHIAQLIPGLYELRIEARGFSLHVATKLELTLGQIGLYDVQLRVGAVTNEVSVTADPPLIETERTGQADTIRSIQVESLPNLNRNYREYAYTLSDVTNSEAPRLQDTRFVFGTSGFSIGGSNGRSNYVTVDGGENEFGSGEPRIRVLSPEAIQEFQINRNAFAAEFGFTSGTAVNIITRGGSNDWRGSVYAFYRSQKTSAREFFDYRPEKAFDQRIYPGLTFSGPIIRNKAHFFTSYEYRKFDEARFRGYTDNAQFTGARPAAGQEAYLTQLEAAANPENIRRIGANLRAALSAPFSAATVNLLRGSEGTFNSPDRQHSWTTRIDYQIGANDSLTGRFSFSRENNDNLSAINGQAPGSSTDLEVRDYTTVVNWNHTFNSNLLNVVRVQFAPGLRASTFPVEPDGTSKVIQGIGNFGRPATAPFDTRETRLQFDETVARIRGSHTLKFGGSYRPVSYKITNEIFFSGSWTFQSLPPLLLVPAADRAALSAFNTQRFGSANGPATANSTALQAFNLNLPFQWTQGFNNPATEAWAHYLGLFAQDSWKVTRRLTLDYGLRFDFDGEPKPLNKKGYVSPRLGFAWDPWGNQKTVIRGGGGLFYATTNYQVFYLPTLQGDSGEFINQIIKRITDAGPNSVTLWQAGMAAGVLPDKMLSREFVERLGITTGRGGQDRRILEASPDYENTYSIQGSLGISRQLVRDLSLEVAYQVYRSVHLQMPHEVNYRESGSLSAVPGAGPQYARIDPTISTRIRYSSIGNAIYHGMTTSLRKRLSNNFLFQINYTLSKAIDDTTDFNAAFAPAFPTRIFLDRARSTFDVRHNYVVSGVFRSPFKRGSDHNFVSRTLADITLSPFLIHRSGVPFTLTYGADVNGDTNTSDRPILASRNTGRGPNFFTINLRLGKQFFFTRDKKLRAEFLVEATNLLNHTNFLAVNNVFGINPATWAQVGFDPINGPFDLEGTKNSSRTTPLGFTATSSPRQFQFGLKIAF